MKKNLTELSNELKNLIRKYEHRSFVAHWGYLANAHYRTGQTDTKLLSPVRQMMYLMALYHSTDFGGTEYFEAYGSDYDDIVGLLNEIEKQYIVVPGDIHANEQYREAKEKIFVSNTTFLNYYLNAPLAYTEQDIERIRSTFGSFDDHIKDEYGLGLEDFIQFFIQISEMETSLYESFFNRKYTAEEHALILRARDNPGDMSESEFDKLFELTDSNIFGLAITIDSLKQRMGIQKADTLLELFTLIRKEDSYLYYTDPCPCLQRPIMMTDAGHLVLVYSKQLINAIYDCLFDCCTGIDATGRKVLDRRESYLEHKTAEIFRDFFGKKAEIYTNYTISGSEKDLLVVTPHYAFIIECKANRYRIPFRDPLKAFDRIRDDFKRSIGKAYRQAEEVRELFASGNPITITDMKGKGLGTIHPRKFKKVFSIVVTQERFGQIQCNLAHLLEVGEEDPYPWAVGIDDLETFLITLERKVNHIHEFVTYLTYREMLHGRLYCFDELELCAQFLMQRQKFISYCDHTAPFLSGSDVNLFFDDLYHSGFGFKDELYLSRKMKRNSPIVNGLVKALKLRKPARLRNS